MFKYLLLFTLLFSSSFELLASEIVVNKISTPQNHLVFDILKLALSKSNPEATFSMQTEESREENVIEDVKAGRTSVMWAATTPEHERQLLPIRLPILKGLLGHRIMIIRNGEQPLFDKIHNINDLKGLMAGQGRFWGETLVFKESGLPIATTLKYKNLFPMLEGDRFDYFPRAVHEPWNEVKQYSELNLTVEKKLLLVYPYAMYFFVSRDNPQLAKQIESGFEQAIADGSFDELFFNNSLISSALDQADLPSRTVLRLPNSNIPAETPLKQQKLWLDISSLKTKSAATAGQLAQHY